MNLPAITARTLKDATTSRMSKRGELKTLEREEAENTPQIITRLSGSGPLHKMLAEAVFAYRCAVVAARSGAEADAGSGRS